ncbi:ATP-binding protein [Caballeronia sp. 15715]|uniref:ATP-binding protein n=1 Tax=unclassified Caballeronia TaxID=2646786 RepID=UPI0039E2A8CC
MSARGKGDCVTVAVANEGQPIPAHLVAHIFDPLTRAYSPPERRGTAAGIGLDLSICRALPRRTAAASTSTQQIQRPRPK